MTKPAKPRSSASHMASVPMRTGRPPLPKARHSSSGISEFFMPCRAHPAVCKPAVGLTGRRAVLCQPPAQARDEPDQRARHCCPDHLAPAE